MKIGITMGDPKGIGPEIVAKAAKLISPDISPRIYGDRSMLGYAAEIAKTSFNPKHLAITSDVASSPDMLSDLKAAQAAMSALDAAAEDVKSGAISAIVTAPVNKRRMQIIDSSFIGHTEHLAALAGVEDTVMMFAHKDLRISLATTHLALKDISKHLTTRRIFTTIRITADALSYYFGCAKPSIAVLALNPHAGEDGVLGTEEKEIIEPAVSKARKEGIDCFGPLSPETIFSGIADINFDGIVAMYHDQGLTPMKIICPKKSVNVTLGLPYIRTSPGHGTAEDIAWTGKASEDGMIAAIETAGYLLRRRS